LVPPAPGREEIIDWLGRAGEQAQHAEAYHAAAADPAALQGPAAHQAARDAAAMQLIELAGCAEDFILYRGDPGTTLARLDDVLETVTDMRTAHTHPENGVPAAAIAPRRLNEIIGQLRTAIENLDDYTRKIQPPDQNRALDEMMAGIMRIEKDRVPDAAALRPRDLHYAGYYREIQFGRLAKATRLFDSWEKSFRHEDPRHVDVNARIFAADDLAHKLHDMRRGADKSLLPASVVASDRRGGVPGRLISEIIRELRNEYQTPLEALEELNRTAAARAREEHRETVRGFAQDYARMTGDPTAAELIHEYVQRQSPPLDRNEINEMRVALQVAADPNGNYPALPEAVRNRCLYLCMTLSDEQGDRRLLDILDAADRKREIARATEITQGGAHLSFAERFGRIAPREADAERGHDQEREQDYEPDV
jgi:hypothetical protein